MQKVPLLDLTRADRPEYLLVFYRRADLSDEVLKLIEAAEPMIEYRRQNVLLAGLYRLTGNP